MSLSENQKDKKLGSGRRVGAGKKLGSGISSNSSVGNDDNGESSSSVTIGSAMKSKTKGGGLDEIESLFGEKKKQKRQQRLDEAETEKAAASFKKRKTKMMVDKNKISSSSPGNSSARGSTSDGGGGNRSRSEWTDDGLGGVYNAEGFTGRNEDGVRIFKAHLFNKPNFGNSKDCPFDCDCCYI